MAAFHVVEKHYNFYQFQVKMQVCFLYIILHAFRNCCFTRKKIVNYISRFECFTFLRKFRVRKGIFKLLFSQTAAEYGMHLVDFQKYPC